MMPPVEREIASPSDGSPAAENPGRARRRAKLSETERPTLEAWLDESRGLHQEIRARMADSTFDLREAWERKARLDAAIGDLIRKASSP